jgi:hypothetical protein
MELPDKVWEWAEKALPGPLWTALLALAVIVGILVALGGAAEGFGKLKTGLQGLPFTKARRARRRARRDFAKHVLARIEAVERGERWADTDFIDLEVEVRPGDRTLPGLARFVPRRRGLRRRRSLTRQLRRRTDHLTLVTGDAGSGKSMALREVARIMASHAARSLRSNATIPVYVNLKALDPGAAAVDDLLIRRFVRASLEAVGGQEVADFLDARAQADGPDAFEAGVKDGTWLFLLDSFDEIPEVLSATEVNATVARYTSAIEAFAAGHSCRVVVSSRLFRAPRARGWTSIAIAPLSDRRQRRLIRATGLTREARNLLREELPNAQADVAARAREPLFLALLCEHMRYAPRLPEFPHEVFESAISRRLSSQSDEILEAHGLSETDLRAGSAAVAFAIGASGIGLQPRRTVLVQTVADLGVGSAARTNAALDALVDIRLARGSSERHHATPEQQTFTFAHRRFQEYFATVAVREYGASVENETLLTDAQWRETVVTLFQTGHEVVPGLLETVTRLMSAHALAAASAERFEWPPGSVHLLGLLQSGFGAAPERLPDAVLEPAAALLTAAWDSSDDNHRRRALDLIGAAPDAVQRELLTAAFGTGSQWLREAAYAQAGRRPAIARELGASIRMALVDLAVSGRLRRERHAIRAQLERVEGVPSLLRAFRLLLVTRPVDFVLLLVTLALLIRGVGGSVWESNLLMGIAASIGAYLTWPSFAEGSVRAAAEGAPMGRSAAVQLPTRLVMGFAVWLVMPWDTGPRFLFLSLTLLGALYLVSWPVAVVYAVIRDRGLGPPWLQVHLALFNAIKPTSVWSVIVGGGIGLLGVAALFGVGYAVFTWMPKTGDVIVGAILAALYAGFVVWMLILVARSSGSDYWRWLRWRWGPSRELTGVEFLRTLTAYKTGAGVVRVAKAVRREHLLRADAHSEAVVADLQRIAQQGWDETPGINYAVVDEWVDGNSRERLQAIRLAGIELRDELGPLREEIRQRIEEQAALRRRDP